VNLKVRMGEDGSWISLPLACDEGGDAWLLPVFKLSNDLLFAVPVPLGLLDFGLPLRAFPMLGLALGGGAEL
jgi:hypothetical protein